MTPKTAPSLDTAGDSDRFMAAATELTALLDRETALVLAMKINEIEPLQADKLRLTRIIEKVIKGEADAPPAGPEMARRRVVVRRLTEAVMANERALRIGRTATERLISAIVTAVKQTRQPTATYARRRATLITPPIAGVAVDRRL